MMLGALETEDRQRGYMQGISHDTNILTLRSEQKARNLPSLQTEGITLFSGALSR